MSSLLITVEGIDGSGKTTLVKSLKKKNELGLVVSNWRDTKLGEKVWNLINEAKAIDQSGLPSNWSYIFFLFVAFEELVKEVVRPSLQNNKLVVLDRYLDSTFVYQGLAGDLEIDIIREIAEKTINISLPDITFVLDIDPLKAQERLNKRKKETNEYSNFDALKLEFHQKVRDGYLELKKIFPERIVFINAEQKEDKILTEVQTIINQSRDKKNWPSLARVVIQNEKGEVLVVKDKKWGWNFPGGKVEDNENFEKAAYREVFEETNLIVKDLAIMAIEDVFFANLAEDNRWWKGCFYQTSKYFGEIKIKEQKKILAVKFVPYHSPEAREARHAFHKFFRNYHQLAENVKEDKNKYIECSVVVIQNTEKHYLLTYNKKYNAWTFPGGKLELGETPLEAAKREVFEETNLQVENLTKLGESLFLFLGDMWYKCHLYQAGQFLGKLQAREKENGSIIDVKFFSKKEISKINLSKGTKHLFKELLNYEE